MRQSRRQPMPLSSGTRLGPYEIQAAIGAGGMGEVYKAHDTGLDRTVAIKVLPPEFSGDPDRRARFEREARTIASLNHPHICTLHDVGEHGDSTYLVMEHLAGETLAERLQKGRLPPDQALTVATEIADALAAAHRQGIIHRDLKPGNVMLTKAGAKLLDFGLAKLAGHGAEPAVAHLASAATRSAPLTAEGTIVGTLQYMAPEQVEGRPADARTDLWALGSILYEMLTGKRAFEGESHVSLIGNIMNAEPAALATLQPLTPPALERVVATCLSKQPDNRWDTAHDVADELRWISRSSMSSPALLVARSQRRVWLTRAGWAAALAVVALAGALANARFGVLGWGSPRRPAADNVAHLDIVLPQDAPFWVDPLGFPPSLALSPDGSVIAYTCTRGNSTQICLRHLDRSDVSLIAGTEGGRFPAFSPDGRWVVFCVATRHTFCEAGAPLKKVSVRDRRVDPLGTIPEGVALPPPPAWSTDTTILLSGYGGIWQVSATGGPAASVVRVDKARGDHNFSYPAILPNGRQMLFSVYTRAAQTIGMEVRVMTLATGEQQVLRRDATFAHYLPTGHLVFLEGKYPGRLVVAPFDAERLEVGSQVPLWDPVRILPEVPALAFARSGSFLYLPVETERVLTWVDRQRRSVPALAERGPWSQPQLSPDGRRVAVEVARDPAYPGIEVVDLNRGVVSSIGIARGRNPLWTADGTRITYNSTGLDTLLWRSADGSDSDETLYRTNDTLMNTGSWSPDGRVLAYWKHGTTDDWETWFLSRSGSPWTSSRFLPLPGSTAPGGGAPRFSPDGHWIAYDSNEDGTFNVYVRSYPTGDQRTQVSVAGGHDAVWSRDGRELFYRDGDRFIGVPVTLTPTFRAGSAQILFSGPYLDAGALVGRGYDVSRDGRFLVVQVSEEEREPRRFHLVQNWFEEVKAKVPAGGAK